MTDTVTRIPLEDIKGIIARALGQGDYEHSCEWTRPDSCPCHQLGLQRCTQYDGIHGKCQGYPVEVPTPAAHVVTLDILTAALTPDTEGTVGKQEAATAILSVITARLSGDYILRAHSLAKRLSEVSELYEQARHVPDSVIPATAVSVLTCQWCQAPIPLARGPKARYCRNSHRVSAHRAKKREQERQANAGASPGR